MPQTQIAPSEPTPPKNSDSSMATIFPGSSRCLFFSEEHLQVVHHHSPPAALLGHILKRFSRWVSPASAASNSSSEIWQVGKMEFCQLWIFWELHQVDCLSMSHPKDPCMLYMATFTINIPPMLAYIYQHHGSYGSVTRNCPLKRRWKHRASQREMEKWRWGEIHGLKEAEQLVKGTTTKTTSGDKGCLRSKNMSIRLPVEIAATLSVCLFHAFKWLLLWPRIAPIC